jgi:hypothetical protein
MLRGTAVWIWMQVVEVKSNPSGSVSSAVCGCGYLYLTSDISALAHQPIKRENVRVVVCVPAWRVRACPRVHPGPRCPGPK